MRGTARMGRLTATVYLHRCWHGTASVAFDVAPKYIPVFHGLTDRLVRFNIADRHYALIRTNRNTCKTSIVESF